MNQKKLLSRIVHIVHKKKKEKSKKKSKSIIIGKYETFSIVKNTIVCS